MRKITFLALFILFASTITAQNKKSLTFDDILKWNRITEQMISNDGKFVVYKNEPWKGDPVLKISSSAGVEQFSLIGGTGASLTQDSKFVVFTIKPETEVVRQLKLKKTKKEKLPKDALGIYDLTKNSLTKIENLKSYKTPEKWSGWIAYQTEAEIVEVKKDSTEAEKPKAKKAKEESAKNGYSLQVKNLNADEMISFPFVTQYLFAEEGKVLTFVSTGNDKDFKEGVYKFDAITKSNTAIYLGKADFKQLSIRKDGSKIAFLADTSNSKDEAKNYALYLWNGNDMSKEVVNNTNKAIPENWEISDNGRISFAEETNRIFFGTAPIRPVKDTTILDEEIPVLDIWLWNEARLHTEQLYTKSRDLRKTYMAVYHADQGKIAQLENPNYDRISLINDGDADQVLAYSNVPYAIQTMWEGSPEHADFYLVDIFTGKAKMIKQDLRANPSVSPAGKFLYWYNSIDTSWNSYDLKSGQEYKLTSPNTVQCANELNDVPNPPNAYGIAGWLKDDEAMIVYDRFDIWQLDPVNKNNPLNLTINGKKLQTSYRLIDLENVSSGFRGGSAEGIDIKKTAYLSGHNEITREEGYYKTSLKKAAEPTKLISGEFSFGRLIKAKDAEVVLYTKEDFQVYPNILLSDLNFKNSRQISDANPQQKDFLWGSAELVNWTSLDGRKLQGTLHKPENFDPNKKYPLIVNFYEKNSQELYSYRMPEAHRSTVDYHYYTSNGYLVFNPDIYYKTGYPGEDAFNCIMPGITSLIEKGFVEENHIAAQGHSWGGYQVAYLATRTNIFAAIESGAPVVNMFSAYGGIRWGSGLNRSFQYEHAQSRIGKSIWESPLRYIENSPIFSMDKVQTPILIMHNDDDGAVPWYQGIEYFTALRRMGKQVWLLNYNEADHWPLLVRDKYDFQIRMAQFFDHFLKGKPMPKWMKEGVPAINKGFEMGYELVK
ncbi:MAG: prolyl oligopeptidase family serine peptidase [Bacteroidetes bacterium]|nr:prolyl oligopeptidase family serine peptidase [Bacteroidota bacterium]